MIPTIGRWPQAPDLIEPIVGFRAWRFTANDQGIEVLSFVSAVGGSPAKNDWDGAWARWVTASCTLCGEPGHVAPDESCSCGFYATKTADDLALFAPAILDQPASRRQAARTEGAVLGRVLLAGKVIEHDSGYRAERARIAELIPTTTDGGMTRSLARRLGLPVGPTWDTAAVLDQMRIELDRELGTTGPSPRLRLRQRVLLRTHRRHFRLIQGTRDD